MSSPVLVASLSLNILSLVAPIAILLIFDRVIPFQSNETLRMLAFALLVSAFAEFALRWARSITLNYACEDSTLRNHSTFLHLSLNADPNQYAREPAAVHFERYSALGRLRDYYTGQNQALIIDLPFSLIFIAMIGLIGGWLLVVPLVTLAGILGFALVVKRAQRRIFVKRQTLDARRYAFLSEVLNGISSVKANTMERQMARRFELLEDSTVDVSQRLIVFSGLAQSYGAVLAQFAVVAMGIVGAFFVIQNAIGIAELAACMLLNGRVTQPLMKVLSVWIQAENVGAARAQLNQLSSIKTYADGHRLEQSINGRIELNRVEIAHPGTGEVLFDKVTNTIEPGETILLEASDKASVDALFDVLLGYQTPSSGFTYIDGRLPSELRARRGRNGIVKLESVPAIFSGTLLENLSGFGDASQVDYAIACAASLGLETRIHRLPMGYNTQMKTGSLFEKDPVNRHLISLVRAIAMKPKILLMMEPTVALETKDRELLASFLASWDPSDKPTILVFSPDPRMRAIADRVISLYSASEQTIAEFDSDAQREPFLDTTRTKVVA